MLSVYFGHLDDELGLADGWFDNQLDDKYYCTEFSKRVVSEIDNSEVINENMVISPVLGGIPITDISSGSKGLIVMKYTDRKVNLVSLGDNCIPLLLEIAHEKPDMSLVSARYINFYKFGWEEQILVLNSNQIVHSQSELFDAYLEVK